MKDISLTSVGVSYIVPTSFRSMDAKLLLGVNNPAISFAVREISGTIYYKEKPIVDFMTGSMELEGKTEKVYELPCTVTLCEGASLLDILAIAARRSLQDLTADIDVHTGLKKHGAYHAPLKFRKLQLSRFSQ